MNNKKIDYGEATINALRRGTIESSKRDERYKLVFSIEQTKWPHDMGKKLRSEIPKELHSLLDECITKSQSVAGDACQTDELTKEYLKSNNNDK